MRRVVQFITVLMVSMIGHVAMAQDAEEVESAPQLTLEQKMHRHQLMVGFGYPLCGVVAIDGDSGGGCFPGNGFFANFPILYHRRFNERIAVGGGLMLTVLAVKGFGLGGAELVGSFRFYALPDYLYFGAQLFLGFPLLVGFTPLIGHAFSVGEKVNLFIENQFPMMALGAFVGFWQPVIGVEFKF